MRVSRHQNSTGTSLASARTTAQLQSNPTPRSVRNQRFIPQQTANQVLREGLGEAETALAVGNAISGVVQTIGAKVEEAEFRSQAQRAVNQYQKDTAALRAGQINSRVAYTDESGKRILPSDTFGSDYSEQTTQFAGRIYDGGLTNRRAQEYFENQRAEIDAGHTKDINKQALDARTEVAKSDFIDTLETSATKAGIIEAVDNAAETGLIPFSERQKYVEDYNTKLNFRNSLSMLQARNNHANNTNISNSEFFAMTEDSVNQATDMLISGDLKPAQQKQIIAQVKLVEQNRRDQIGQTQGLNLFAVTTGMMEAQAKGEDVNAIFTGLVSSQQGRQQLINQLGADGAMAFVKANKATIAGGSPNLQTQARALQVVDNYTNGLVDYESAQEAIINNASQLGSVGVATAFNKLTTARKGRHVEKKQTARGIADAVVFSKFNQVDEDTGNANQFALEAKKQAYSDIDVLMSKSPYSFDNAGNKIVDEALVAAQDDPGKWWFNNFANSVEMPSYASEESLRNFDVGKAKKYLTDYRDQNDDNWDKVQTTSDGTQVPNLGAWYEYETKKLDELASFKKMLTKRNFLDMIDEPDRFGYKRVQDENGGIGYE